MIIHWKAVEQYFTVVLFVNRLTPRQKPWVTQSFLTFDSMDRTLKCDHSLESFGFEQYFTVELFVFQFYPLFNFRKFIDLGLGTAKSERVNPSIVNSKKLLV